MVDQSDARKKRVAKKTAKGRKKFHIRREKTGKICCAICSKKLHGMLQGKTIAQLSKHGKSHKRPSVLFGGTLCSNCRKSIMEEAAKIKFGLKKIGKTAISTKKFVEQALKSIK